MTTRGDDTAGRGRRRRGSGAPGQRLTEALTVARFPLEPWARPDVAPSEYPSESPFDDPAEPEVVDLRPQAATVEGPVRHTDHHYGMGRQWGSGWSRSAQGWVDDGGAASTWRPVVTTTIDFPDWDIDTYLGVVSGEAVVEHAAGNTEALGVALAEAREAAMRGLIDAAVTRGAHAVVGAGLSYTPVGRKLLVTAHGTAVALRDRT